MKKFNDSIKTCLQDEPAFCTAACPFGLDVHDFIPKIKRGAYNAAYRTYLNATGFPAIVAELCPEPCKAACPRHLKDEAIDLRLLEKAAIRYARNLEPNSYNLPPKNKKIAVIGAGLSGLGCALRLASKKYSVTVFEKTARLGGRLWDLLPPELFLGEIKRQFMHEEVDFKTNTEIKALESLDFDAIYLATGQGGEAFGLKKDPGGAFASTKAGVFMGGALCGKNTIEALADGLHATRAIERYLKTGAMNEPVAETGTKIKINPDFITKQNKTAPTENGFYSKEEAKFEAARCLLCRCDACISHCDLMKFYSKFPRRIGEEVHITVYPGTLDGDGTIATRLISTCNHCGLCKEVCPQGIDTGDLLLQSHRAMREKGAMPWAFHDFWLRDMQFASSSEAALCRLPQGYDKSAYMFFPGCQLGASDPRYVTESYSFLTALYPDTALNLGCCGAPAEWAGEGPLHRDVIDKLRQDWQKAGKPTMVFACPTCSQMFAEYLPEIKRVFLYSLMAETNFKAARAGEKEKVSVFDPCTSRHEPELHQAVRALAKKADFKLQSLPYEGHYARCCSWGGQVSVANPSYSREVVKVRISQNDLPYIAYCANCRDIFAAAGKPCYHLLDVLFGLNEAQRKPPTLTGRRYNRVMLKGLALEKFWQEKPEGDAMEKKIKLHIAPLLKEKLSAEMILETDIEKVIEHCESTGKKIINEANGSFAGHLLVDSTTYWVEYRAAGEGFELLKAYSHRMQIEED